jgi:hypothetical protein
VDRRSFQRIAKSADKPLDLAIQREQIAASRLSKEDLPFVPFRALRVRVPRVRGYQAGGSLA